MMVFFQLFDTKKVTGDHPLTAEAIGRKINLMVSDTKARLAERTGRNIDTIKEDEYFAIVIHGETIDSLTDEDWENIFTKDEIIFARYGKMPPQSNGGNNSEQVQSTS